MVNVFLFDKIVSFVMLILPAEDGQVIAREAVELSLRTKRAYCRQSQWKTLRGEPFPFPEFIERNLDRRASEGVVRVRSERLRTVG